MRKTTSAWLLAASALVLIGCILFAGVMTRLGWDFTKLSTVSYKTNTHEISQAFDGISMSTDTADIEFVFSDEVNCRVECHEAENANHSVTVKNGILTVESNDERHNFIGHIGLNFDTPKITVYLPKAQYTSLSIDESTGDIVIPQEFSFRDVDISLNTGDVAFDASTSGTVKIKTSTGDIRIRNISAGTLDLTVSTGKTYLTDIRCERVISSGDTGEIALKNVIAAQAFSIHRSTGNVSFDSCDAAEITVETDTGDVSGSLLTDKVFVIETSTGKKDVPGTVSGGRCEITTSTGDIVLTIA